MASSLLELRGHGGADGPVPLTHEVEADFRHARLGWGQRDQLGSLWFWFWRVSMRRVSPDWTSFLQSFTCVLPPLPCPEDVQLMSLAHAGRHETVRVDIGDTTSCTNQFSFLCTFSECRVLDLTVPVPARPSTTMTMTHSEMDLQHSQIPGPSHMRDGFTTLKKTL